MSLEAKTAVFGFLSPSNNLSDSILARELQEEFEQEIALNSLDNENTRNMSDFMLAQHLHQQFQQEEAINKPVDNLVYDNKKKIRQDTKSLIDPSWEVIDPTPDIHVLFINFNKKFFWGKLDAVCVSWSKRMKRCAGICSYQGRAGLCHISLSEPLLKLRPRKDLIETLLHEMIHAYLFVTHNNKDRDGHGPEFHKHMYRINSEAGTNITVYHDFHDEVELYLQHWWRCDGPCQKWRPYFGIVRRSANRAPGPNDKWWGTHSRSCGGTFIKIKSPEPKTTTSKKGKENKATNSILNYIETTGNKKNLPSTSDKKNITNLIGKKTSSSSSSNIHTMSKTGMGKPVAVTISSKTNNIHGFSNNTNKGQGGKTCINSNTVVITKKPSVSTSTIEKKSETKYPVSDKQNGTESPPIDYSVVRNHWANKFSNSHKSSSSTSTSNSSSSSSLNNVSLISTHKRKNPDIYPTVSKAPKLGNSSQESVNCDKVCCPICNISYSIVELNTHLDICLVSSNSRQKECIICLKHIKETEYQQHVDACVQENFDDDVFIDEPNNDSSVILIEDNSINVSSVSSTSENRESDISEVLENNVCPQCGKDTTSENYDIHLSECLIEKLDDMERQLNPGKKIEMVTKCDGDEKVDCLVCGKSISKTSLNSHLDDCLTGVFNDDDDNNEPNNAENDDKLYNCPFCLKLVTEVEMSDHIDVCLKITDRDEEAENNKKLFLDELN